MITVLIVEDDPQHVLHYRQIIASTQDLQCIGSTGSVREALVQMQRSSPDVVLVDLGLSDGSGQEVIAAARRHSPQTEILVVSVFGDETSLLSALRAGATGYLLKDSLPADFAGAIRDVRAGRSPISPSLARHLLRAYLDRPTAEAQDVSPLSDRELEILRRVGRGQTFSEIAGHLEISTHTVSTHVKNIYRKLEAHSKNEAVYLARRRGFID